MATPLRVAALALEGVVSFDLACAVQVFNRGPDPSGRPEHFTLRTCGLRPGTVATPDGYRLHVDHGLEALAGADVVVVPGHHPFDAGLPDSACRALRDAHQRGATVASICVGAFLLGHAGLLDDRPATTHWAYCASLAEAFPRVEVRPNDLFVDDGSVLTSAGLAAGLDLCLHLARREAGTAAASRLARWNVVAPHRDGGQAQFIPTSSPFVASGDVGPTVAWAQRHLHERPNVARLAEHACMSERTFSRRFRAEVGVPPKRWLLEQRTRLARELLEQTEMSVEAIAEQAGFPSSAALRVQLRRQIGTTPTAYRRTFGSPS